MDCYINCEFLSHEKFLEAKSFIHFSIFLVFLKQCVCIRIINTNTLLHMSVFLCTKLQSRRLIWHDIINTGN